MAKVLIEVDDGDLERLVNTARAAIDQGKITEDDEVFQAEASIGAVRAAMEKTRKGAAA